MPEYRAKYIGAFTDVKIIFNNPPFDITTNRPLITVSFVRRKRSNGDGTFNNEVRFKVKFKDSQSWSYLGGDYTIPFSDEVQGAPTPFKKSLYGGSNIGFVDISCMIDWSVFPEGYSDWVDGPDGNSYCNADPYFIISSNRMFLFDICETTKKDYLNNQNVKNLVPSCQLYFGNYNTDLYCVIKTPYKFSDNVRLNIIIGIDSTSENSENFIKSSEVKVSYWARNNETYYGNVESIWEVPDYVSKAKIQVGVNANDYLCILLSSSGSANLAYTFGHNLNIFVKEVITFGLGEEIRYPKSTGWNIFSTSDISSYSKLSTSVDRTFPKPDISDAYFITRPHTGYTIGEYFNSFIPTVCYYVNGSDNRYDDLNIKIALPQTFSRALNAKYRA